VPGAVIRHRNGTKGIIDKVQLVAAPQHVGELSAGVVIILIDRAAHRLGAAKAIGVVGIGDGGAGLGHARQLPAMLPRVSPRAVIRQVADGVVGQRLAVVSRQQILPRRVAVGVGLGGGGGAEGALSRYSLALHVKTWGTAFFAAVFPRWERVCKQRHCFRKAKIHLRLSNQVTSRSYHIAQRLSFFVSQQK